MAASTSTSDAGVFFVAAAVAMGIVGSHWYAAQDAVRRQYPWVKGDLALRTMLPELIWEATVPKEARRRYVLSDAWGVLACFLLGAGVWNAHGTSSALLFFGIGVLGAWQFQKHLRRFANQDYPYLPILYITLLIVFGPSYDDILRHGARLIRRILK